MADETSIDATESEKALKKLQSDLARIEALNQRFINVMAHKREVPAALQGPGQDLYVKAAAAYMAEMMQNPGRIVELQVDSWTSTLKNYLQAQHDAAHGVDPEKVAPPKDKRFANPLWETNPYFHFLKQQYELTTDVMKRSVESLSGLEETDRNRLNFFSQQFLNVMSPMNFLLTNPDALQRLTETEGESLIDGLENLVADLEANDGELVVSLTDRDAFRLGENIATSDGQVVYRNELFELIQYAPNTDQVKKTPLIIFPPWINKFYVMDLQEKNSLVKWIVEQGYTLFMVSWRNVDPSFADYGLSDYISKGYLEAIGQVKEICEVDQVNVVGYCIAGTTLSLALSGMAQNGDNSVNSATYFTTLTDFSDQGEFEVFLTNDFLSGIEEEVREKGILESFYMARTFSYLRANDLVYQPAVKTYLMGEKPSAFDLLYWNGDGTNLPAKMAVEYLRGLCQHNAFADGGITLDGTTYKIADVNVPVCAIACETDHIAAWKASYNGIRQFGSVDKTFILSQSGHIAGIINPPTKNKYGHWTNPDLSLEPDVWHAEAEFHEGSWWPRWSDWLAERSGEDVPARALPSQPERNLAPAPGTYVAMPAPKAVIRP